MSIRDSYRIYPSQCNHGATAPGFDFGYVYDAMGNRGGATANGQTSACYQGTENALKIQAARPAAGSIPEQAATENRTVLVPAVPESFVYDTDGNLTQDGLWNYEWDGENRLKAQELRSDVAATAVWKRLEYAYDGQGRRIQKVVKTRTTPGGSWTPGADTRFRYDGWNLIAEYAYSAGTFTVLRSHAWGSDLSGSAQGAGGVGGLLWTKVAATAKTYAAGSDANGNVVVYVDCADGTVAGRRDYGAFGEPVLITGIAGSLPFGFSSKYEEKESGLYYYSFRYYNPSTGRWPNRDPIGERGGKALYVFCRNSPISKFDYLGLLVTKYETDTSQIPATPADLSGLDQPGITVLGRTSPTWNFEGGTVKGSSLTVAGTLSIAIFIRNGVDPNAISPGEDIKLIDHERKHAANYKNSWNNLAKVVNLYEGSYCKPECAEIAKELVQWYGVYYASERSIANWQYDLDAYGNAEAEEEIKKSKRNMKSAEDQITALQKDFKDKGCSMPSQSSPPPSK